MRLSETLQKRFSLCDRLDQCNWQYSTFYFWLAAEDNLAFTLGWFAKFPEYKKNKFYLTGESFSGHYLPELAEQIVLYNEKPGLDSKINFKGFAVHNHLSQCDGK
jgi:serine carboxypeptidase-like clade 2